MEHNSQIDVFKLNFRYVISRRANKYTRPSFKG